LANKDQKLVLLVCIRDVLALAYFIMNPAFAFVNWADGALQAPGVQRSEKKLGQLTGIFRDQKAWQQLDPETIVYRVWWWEPVAPGTEGGLFWGLTEIEPGKVGNEYFMTRGHWHVIRNRAEFYGTVAGCGKLVLMDRAGRTWSEDMTTGSLHYVTGEIAHRIVNTGNIPIRVIACWPSDAGHDYDIAEGRGFSQRVIEERGAPMLVSARD
jgi:glucose-6-phosphate isomerase